VEDWEWRVVGGMFVAWSMRQMRKVAMLASWTPSEPERQEWRVQMVRMSASWALSKPGEAGVAVVRVTGG
jgi:hypothetical protein